MSRSQANAREISQELRGAVEHAGEQRDRPPPRKTGLHWRDMEDLEWYSGKGVDLVQRSPLGAQLERLHDEVGITNGLPSTNPTWILDYSGHTDSARARRIATRIMRAGRTERRAPAVLLAYHSPVAVGCDGITFESSEGARTTQGKVDVGRILALYPMTETAAEARRWNDCEPDRKAGVGVMLLSRWLCGEKHKSHGEEYERIGKVVSLAGRTPADALRLMAATKRGAKGDEKDAWTRIHREATELLRVSIEAWIAAKDAPEVETFASGETMAGLTAVALDALPATETMRGIGL